MNLVILFQEFTRSFRNKTDKICRDYRTINFIYYFVFIYMYLRVPSTVILIFKINEHKLDV